MTAWSDELLMRVSLSRFADPAPPAGGARSGGGMSLLDLHCLLSAMDTGMCRSLFPRPTLSLSLAIRGIMAGTALLAQASAGGAVSRGHGGGAGKSRVWSTAACMAMVGEDPFGARDYAQDWLSGGGGRDARHCHALALLNVGEEDTAAQELDDLAHAPADSHAELATPALRGMLAGEAAQAWLSAGQAGRGLASAEYGLSLTPHDPTLLISRARSLLAQNRADRAVADLSALVAQSPGVDPSAYVLLASAQRQLGQLDAALQSVSHALEKEPNNPAALLERGIIRERKADPAGARKDWQQVLDLAPDSHEGDLARQDLAVMAADPDSP
ncbi:MAG: tetratricopeptide repeat protein [Acetobacter sp.]|uniref:tetratricopeptide repeat protein n=1 Tax=Acetobacter sp. TaxID=440 RepID=UPI0039ED5F76